MKNIYTLITYVPGEDGWHDRCGDYHHGKDSEFEKRYFNDKDEAANALGYAYFNNDSNDNGVTFLINGVELYPNECECEDILSEQEFLLFKNEFEEIDTIAFNLRQKLSSEKLKREEDAKLKKQAEEALRQKKERDRIESQEREQLNKLLNKYGTK